MYKALAHFRDTADGLYEYKVGDTYPREGFEPSEERLQLLLSSDNKRGCPVIREVASEAVIEESVQEPKMEEAPKKKTRRKSK